MAGSLHRLAAGRAALVALALLALAAAAPGARAAHGARALLVSGSVGVVATLDGAVYVGGELERVGVRSSAVAVIRAGTGDVLAADAATAAAAGRATVVAPDGDDGFYLGGVLPGGRRIVHVAADGAIVPAFSRIGGAPPLAMAFRDGTLFAVLIDRSLVALDGATGSARTWPAAPIAATSDPFTMVVTARAVYVGSRAPSACDAANPCAGGPGRIEGRAIATGAAITGLPAAGSVIALGGADGHLYAHAAATDDGQPNVEWSAYDELAATSHAWSPPAGLEDVSTYSGMAFTLIGLPGGDLLAVRSVDDWDRTDVFRIAAGAGAVRWHLVGRAAAYGAVARGGRAYLVGNLSRLGRTRLPGSATIDLATGTPHPWRPRIDTVDAGLLAVATRSRVVLVSSTVLNVGGLFRQHAFAVDATTGAVLPWSPRPDGEVSLLAPVGGRLLLAGAFRHVNGLPRPGLALVDRRGRVASWRTPLRWSLDGLLADGPVIWAFGGRDMPDGDSTPPAVAALSAHTGRVLASRPLGGELLDYASDGRLLYVATGESGAPHSLAAYELRPRRVVLRWRRQMPGAADITALAPRRGGGVLVALSHGEDGLIAEVSGSGRITGVLQRADGPIASMLPADGVIYVGGQFDRMGGERRTLAAIDEATGRVLGWDGERYLPMLAYGPAGTLDATRRVLALGAYGNGLDSLALLPRGTLPR